MNKPENGKPIQLWLNGAPRLDGLEPKVEPDITPYLLDSKEPLGAILICPGGGYSILSSKEEKNIVEWLNDSGFQAIVLHYRVAPHSHPSPILDVQRALRTIRHNAKEWNIKPNRIAVLGFSAGGHLAASASTKFNETFNSPVDAIDKESARPDASVLCYPVITFGEHRHNGSMVNLIGEEPNDEMRSDWSLETQVNTDTPPAFIWHTFEDRGVPMENSLLYAASLRSFGIPFELHVFPDGVHGLNLAKETPGADAWPSLCAAWLKRQGF